MSDCLPEPGEWSPASQYVFLQDHLEAMLAHAQHLHEAAQKDFPTLLERAEELEELQQRLIEARAQWQTLKKIPAADQRHLKGPRS